MRRMRIVPWNESETNKPMATLVIEWFHDAQKSLTPKVKEDLRYQMDNVEFKELTKSVLEAARWQDDLAPSAYRWRFKIHGEWSKWYFIEPHLYEAFCELNGSRIKEGTQEVQPLYL